MTNNTNTIAKRLKKLRNDLNYSANKMGLVTGYAANYIREIEAGRFDWLAYGNEAAKEFPCDDAMIAFLNSNPELRKYISKKMEAYNYKNGTI